MCVCPRTRVPVHMRVCMYPGDEEQEPEFENKVKINIEIIGPPTCKVSHFTDGLKRRY